MTPCISLAPGMQEHGEYTLIIRLLQSTLKRESEKRLVVPTSTPQFVPALQQRIDRRLSNIAIHSDRMEHGAKEVRQEPMHYMQLCRNYLAKLDTHGWARSYHQRLFHDDFLKAFTRSFWKLEKSGQFARDHQ